MSGQTTDPGNRSSAEIERDVERSRERLAGTLEELRDRAAPGQLFEQFLDYARHSGGSDFVRNLGQSVRDNPLPVLLIGAGIGWLALSGSGGTRAGHAGGYRRGMAAMPGTGHGSGATGYGRATTHGTSHGSGAADDAGDVDGRGDYVPADGRSLGERASATAGGVRDSVAGAAGGLRDSVAGAAERVGDAASAAYHRVADAAGSVAEGVGAGVSSTTRGLRHASHDARDRIGEAGGYLGEESRRGLDWVMREQPLVLGAIGLAVGAAIGALLPGTETEDRLMGETRDEVVARATDTVEEGYRQAKEVAREKLGETTERLDRAGLSPQRMGETLGETARQVREAVAETTRDVAGRAKEAVQPEEPAPHAASGTPGHGQTPAMPPAPGRPTPTA